MSRGDVELPAQAGLPGVRHHLLQRRITNESTIDHAGPVWIGTGQFQWSRRAIRYRIIAVKCEIRRDLVGCADHGIEVSEGVVAIEPRIIAEFVREADIGEVVTSPCGNR